MKLYGVVNAAGTAYYSSGHTYLSKAKIALGYALQHDPEAHIVEYEQKTQGEQIEELIAELKQVKRERDELLKQLKGDCGICAHWQECVDSNFSLERNYNSCWQWRGVKVSE